ncbi:MAG: hypothetical protein E7447_02805 [Ruminococcaceae bacterium]|nr:hypothetical protein [Oscillospiraceae bacterium]
MSEQHADQGHRKFWPLMKSMTWKQRIQHILYYYLKYALLAAFLIYMGVDVLYDAFKPKPEVLLSGTVVNAHISVEMEDRLRSGAFAYMGGTDPDKQVITLVPNKIGYTDLYAGSGLQTKMLAGDYHYCLTDLTGLEMLISMQAFPGLHEVLDEERLARWEGHFRYVQTEGEKFPIAIDITGTPLAKACTYEGDYLFLAFPVNMDEIPTVVAFMDYLTSQGLLEFP